MVFNRHGLFRKSSQRRRSTNRRSSETSPPPSPPPGPPTRGVVDNTRQSFSQIPLVYCDEEPCATAAALPSNNNVAVGVPPVAAVCEVLGPDADACSYADSWAVSTAIPDDSLGYSYATTTTNNVGGGYAGYNNTNNYNTGVRSVSVGSYTTTPPSPYGGYNNARSTSGGYMMTGPPPPPAPYTATTLPSQIHVTHYSGNSTIDTSPTSVRSAYTSTSSYVPGPPGVPARRSAVDVLRESAETTQTMTTSSGVQLQQLPMVNMEGRRMTPYVTKPRCNNNNSARRAAYPSSSHGSAAAATTGTSTR